MSCCHVIGWLEICVKSNWADGPSKGLVNVRILASKIEVFNIISSGIRKKRTCASTVITVVRLSACSGALLSVTAWYLSFLASKHLIKTGLLVPATKSCNQWPCYKKHVISPLTHSCDDEIFLQTQHTMRSCFVNTETLRNGVRVHSVAYFYARVSADGLRGTACPWHQV